jgi:hypothetical protein
MSTRLSQISVRSFTNPHTRFAWPERPPRDRLAMSEQLLPLAALPIWATLDDEMRWRVALAEATQFFSINIAGERELMMGLADRLHRGPSPEVSDYLQHFLHEENAHTFVFVNFCQRYSGKIYPDPQMRLPREYLPGEREFLFFAQVLVFEEIANHYNQHMAADDTLWSLSREINDYHTTDEGRHIAFGRQVVEDLWSEWSPQWSDEGRAGVAGYLARYMEAVLRSYVNPQVYRDLGLPDPLQLRQEALAAPTWRALAAAATDRVSEFLRERGALP